MESVYEFLVSPCLFIIHVEAVLFKLSANMVELLLVPVTSVFTFTQKPINVRRWHVLKRNQVLQVVPRRTLVKSKAIQCTVAIQHVDRQESLVHFARDIAFVVPLPQRCLPFCDTGLHVCAVSHHVRSCDHCITWLRWRELNPLLHFMKVARNRSSTPLQHHKKGAALWQPLSSLATRQQLGQ